ncbi:MAG: UDP-N-acetylglucosamine--N-acetylmuramyl-(pentapeptide) pyrophosphoryl-undecaprenol N-acetylglucosamine transferase [Candidatus Magasanikbacteria bacterium]|mgnify:CR=1 FL=1|jgi:UDP-N-acetylglucosamine--N-acetylmuramyl-(pentapeptide) pyrophosphoryl-undecaprenol N-acetylglucosamine transferase|nr:UDP-N-acetylglucosamine--N-acetylmuramyl-(pentapeptide) pyrophosphoryl-undecaprenol N-acetylglucosamine transferase [Candidatus Magasanikbacteria bacterium]MBT4315355.1 UDP-N-acetylglucosamine--N-acetylmuramyl-(pentapeptide) pyrophosphoryl-undecaprenol N-acetylglucosamine transferase [Candidatus Magasanikbacteria bacterium]MBT4547228.1 UDP-N-acetylglucosamine--N-acetylmuramyl-(pentapeptide) pyrophosphoryl-undecaprenol N-acetylglucosamine transferase [Candidatus Magasanikbacteria bacterium]MBT
MKILFSGGYTLGPVTPLLSIKETIQKQYPDAEFIWIGTKRGPERKLIEEQDIRFLTIASGKLRRYLSLWNFIDIARIIIGWFQSIKIMWKESPDICISAGGFISVPVHWSAWLFGIPSWVHQQDVQVGLANKLMSPFAKIITTALKRNIKDFNKKKTHWIGNPVREEILKGKKSEAIKKFKLKKDLPVVFATGGGTGSMRVNQLIVQAVQHLKGHAQVIHLSGKERPQELVERAVKHFDYYQVHQFFTHEMADAYAVADIVISRGGFGSITEMAALKKPAILVPNPGHQEENVKFLADAEAVLLVDEKTADGNFLAKMIKDLLADDLKKKQMSKQIEKMLPLAKDEDILGIIKYLIK